MGWRLMADPIATATQAATSVPVHVSGFTWTAALVGILNLLVGGALVAAIKNWPRLREMANARRKGDLDDMRQRITVLESEVKSATATALKAQMQMTYVTAALGMVSAELERQDPGNSVIKQAREMVAQATHEDSGFGAALRQLATAKGTGE